MIKTMADFPTTKDWGLQVVVFLSLCFVGLLSLSFLALLRNQNMERLFLVVLF